MKRFKKLGAAVVGAVLMTAYGYWGDQSFTTYEIIQTVSAGVGAFLVWLTANGPAGSAWEYAKTLAYGVSAVLATLLTTLPGGLSGQDKIALVIAFGTTTGVLSLRNDPEPVK